MANKKIVRGKDTATRLADRWQAVLADPDDRPTVQDFAKRAGISASTLYHRYPEWAEKVRLRRDDQRTRPRRLSPAAEKQRQKTVETEALQVVERLRREVSTTREELRTAKADRDRWKKAAQEADKHREMSERLRAVLMKVGSTLKKHLDASKVQAIMDEIGQVQERALRVVQTDSD